MRTGQLPADGDFVEGAARPPCRVSAVLEPGIFGDLHNGLPMNREVKRLLVDVEIRAQARELRWRLDSRCLSWWRVRANRAKQKAPKDGDNTDGPEGSKLNRVSSHVAHDIDRLRDGSWQRTSDYIAIEEPLEIRLSRVERGRRESLALTITMRTPGSDFELAAGFLFGEGIVSWRQDIEAIEYCDDVVSEPDQQNTVLVTLRDGLEVNLEDQRRNFAITSACGVCGKASLAALAMDGCETLHSATTISADTLMSLPGVLRGAQQGFEATGGVHAAGLFTNEGELVALGEDVGRHNAFDKLIGKQFLSGAIEGVQEMAVVLSGRASYELLQKSLRARIPIVAAVGAPSSLAVEIATNFGMTLAGFVKPAGFNVYAGRDRIRD